ncbi:MAG TPA: DUF3341 domain-containing protein [Polyangiaceae bacterium]|jgi:hypothetical protein|nr:DUF3341 domain-containing protein [Polyangiaceae bacterium]
MASALLGEFDSADACAAAIVALTERGHAPLDAYMPYPAKNVEEALALPPSPLPRWVFAAGLTGAGVGYLILWWTQNIGYPLNVGGRPTNAVPAYIGITFETMVLFASFGAFLGMLWLCRLPRLWHPAFELDGFDGAAVDRFFVVLRDDSAEADEAHGELTRAGALRVVPVELDGVGT